MKAATRIALVGGSLLFLLLAGCSGTNSPFSSGEDVGTVTLSILARGAGVSDSATKLAAADSVTVTSARVVIEKVELESVENSALDFKLSEPFVQDLVTITTLQDIQTLQIPFGMYDELKVEVDDLDPQDGAVYTQNPELQDLSILVKGVRNGSEPFEFSSDISLHVKVKFDPPIEINESTLNTNIVLGIDLNAWFLDDQGNFLDPTLPGNKARIEANIRNSFHAFEDRNRDGKQDNKIEVKGAIDSLGTDHLVVSGTTFFVDGNTVIKGEHDARLTFNDLSVGMRVEVRAVRRSDGTWLATRIEVEKEGDDD